MTYNQNIKSLFIILFSFFIGRIHAQENETVSSRLTDSLELVAFHEATNGENWKNQWDFAQPMGDWFGVLLNEQGRVISLDLDGKPDFLTDLDRGNGLSGTLPDLNLPYLERLSLARNRLIGHLPDFSHLPNLKALNLSCNNLTGEIPDFNQIKKLVNLELDYNNFTGNIPDFKHLPQLKNLYLLSNQLNGFIPNFKNCPLLQSLIADNNQLHGRLPLFDKCPHLVRIKCSDNQLSKSLPDWSHLKGLMIIDLANNDLRGELWDWSNNSKLELIILSNNDIRGEMPSLKKMLHLRELDLSNNALSGAIANINHLTKLQSYQVGNNDFVSCPTFEKNNLLKHFSVYGNQLTFKDLVPNQAYFCEQGDYLYQNIFLDDTLIVAKEYDELNIAFLLDYEIKDNIYTWYINGHEFTKKVGIPNLSIQSLSPKHSGTYYCTITNPRLEGLRLKSQSFYVEVGIETNQSNTRPIALADAFEFTSGEDFYEFDISQNDDLQQLNNWNLEIMDMPSVGILEHQGYGKISLRVPRGYSGDLYFNYQLCNVFNDTLCTEASVKVSITAQSKAQLENVFIPEDFSPNGDGIKDYYEIRGLENFTKVSLEIYEQTGRLVYQSDNYQNQWNGKYRNTQTSLPMSIYFYRVILQSPQGQNSVSGSLLLAKD